MIEAVFFDFGGVICHRDRNALLRLEAEYGLPKNGLLKALYDTPEWRKAETGRLSGTKWLEAAGRSLDEMAGRPVLGVQELEALIWPGLDERVLRLVEWLRGSYRVGVISNATKRFEKGWLDRNAIHGLFQIVVNSARVGVAKPDARIFQHAAQALDVLPQACVHVDDWPPNVAGARNAGFQAIHYRGNYAALVRELRALGVEWRVPARAGLIHRRPAR